MRNYATHETRSGLVFLVSLRRTLVLVPLLCLDHMWPHTCLVKKYQIFINIIITKSRLRIEFILILVLFSSVGLNELKNWLIEVLPEL